MINHTNSCSFLNTSLIHYFAWGATYITYFPRSEFDEHINFLHVFWTLVSFFINVQKCVYVVGWLRGYLYRRQICKRVRWCCNSPLFTTQSTESTLINSESGPAFSMLHINLCLLSLIILSSSNLVCSSLSEENSFHTSLSISAPFRVCFTQFPGHNSQSFPFYNVILFSASLCSSRSQHGAGATAGH